MKKYYPYSDFGALTRLWGKHFEAKDQTHCFSKINFVDFLLLRENDELKKHKEREVNVLVTFDSSFKQDLKFARVSPLKSNNYQNIF